MAGHYMPPRRATIDIGADGMAADGTAPSAFAVATPVTVAGAATVAGNGGLGSNNGHRASLPLMGTMTSGYRTVDNNGGSALVAPRPVPAQQQQQMATSVWMMEMLLGLAGPGQQKPKIINDVFFTPEERRASPQLTPVSNIDDGRGRVLPSMAGGDDGLMGLDPSADLALFADLQAGESRSVWGDVEAAASSPRQPSPAATVTADSGDDLGAEGRSSGGAASVSLLSAHVAQAKSEFVRGDSETASLSGESCVEGPAVRESARPTIFEELSHGGVDWCRYCGTTEGINWRPGPWGKRTLCNKHGCDYKGYGFASKMPRLNLKLFAEETLAERIRPVLQTFCQVCQQDTSAEGNVLAQCDGCHRSYHEKCHSEGVGEGTGRWYCEEGCRDNMRRRRIMVELPKCRLPYMCSPRHTQGARDSQDARARKRKADTVDAVDARMSTLRVSRGSKVRKSARVGRPSLKRRVPEE
ncbi:hypothetical protein GGF46_003581 [Coemansia sp. RSA 552]|nr:hypothetical protein GGF46_003581 [Coemansia sp. RSA 552]